MVSAGRVTACSPGDAFDAVAVALEQLLAFEVVRTGEWVVVPLAAVGFDREPEGGDAEVGDDAAALEVQWDVDVGVVGARGEDQVEHEVFELAAGGRGAGEDLREFARAAPRPEPRAGPDEITEGDEVARTRLAPARRRVLASTIAARSMTVRTGEVTGTPLWRRTSSRSRVRDRCARRLSLPRTESPRTVTSTAR